MLKKNIFLSGLVSLVISVLIISCEESFTRVGDAVLPGATSMQIRVDTFENFKFKTVLAEPEKASVVSDFKPIFGHITDDFFGTVKNSVYTQFYCWDNQKITDSKIMDMTLYLDLEKSYFVGQKEGDNPTLQFTIYKLKSNVGGASVFNEIVTDTMPNSQYNVSNAGEAFEKEIIGSKIVNFAQLDTMDFLDIKVSKAFTSSIISLHNKLYDEFNEDTLINGVTVAKYSVNNKKRDSAFINESVGLAIECTYLEPDVNGGALFNLNLSTSNFYLRTLSDTVVTEDVWSNFYFVLANNKSYYKNNVVKENINIKNFYVQKYEYENAGIAKYIGEYNDSLIFQNSIPGITTLVEIPGFDALSDNGEVFINRAKFTIDRANEFSLKNSLSAPICLWAISQDNLSHVSRNYFRMDSLSLVSAGGFELENNRYNILIPHLLQNLVDGELEGNAFSISPSIYSNTYGVTPNKVYYTQQVLDAKSAKLVVTYMTP